MYLKSIEVQGFKSFANKIVFQFHNGITGIVGPNGSGKSNVADAVRWVLGEQRIKQLRGASMQDVIFSGTQTRKPLGYAYVAITLDNSDHQLAIDYDEVTVGRRIYRSGESEYLINQTPCRLKDVNELFYDTGIGKEGYSIIGQGQIDKILSGKPEERRELFDEAAGIVKFKRRKAASQAKLDNEKQNLVRVNDILAELEKQVGPLEKQAEVAKVYLKKREELKNLDVNVFLLQNDRLKEQLSEITEKCEIAQKDYRETTEQYDRIKEEYEKIQQETGTLEEAIEKSRMILTDSGLLRGKLEGQIEVLKEQIRSVKGSKEQLAERQKVIEGDITGREKEKEGILREKEATDRKMEETADQRDRVHEELTRVQEQVQKLDQQIEEQNNFIIEELGRRATIKSQMGRYDTMEEQINLQKAQLNSRILKAKSEEEARKRNILEQEELAQKLLEELKELSAQAKEKEEQLNASRKEIADKESSLLEIQRQYHQICSKKDALSNLAERYEGYGISVRKVMEQREREKGIIGVVADLIKTKKQYETAIETALGGSIQNIVTDREETAKKMIAFLKRERAGRATFLPLSGLAKAQEFRNTAALREPGVIGTADTLAEVEEKYRMVAKSLLGRVLVVDTIDHAIAIARKYDYSIRMVTLEGELFAPGGAISGGAYKNSSSLLGRRREIAELEEASGKLADQVGQTQAQIETEKGQRNKLRIELEGLKMQMQYKSIEQNTAQINATAARERMQEEEEGNTGLKQELVDLEAKILESRTGKECMERKLAESNKAEEAAREQIAAYKKEQELVRKQEEQVSAKAAEWEVAMERIQQTGRFQESNLTRIEEELRRLAAEKEGILNSLQDQSGKVEEKEQSIKELEETIVRSREEERNASVRIKEDAARKELLTKKQSDFFQEREELAEKQNALDKEVYRLNSQKEKAEEAIETLINYMWDEYEMTLSMAAGIRNPQMTDLAAMKKEIASLKEQIRKLGDVNVNAIEDYRNLMERYTFLKGQHDDLVEAEKTLEGIIRELDSAMRKQFLEKFAQINEEYDKVFKELFGGGKGSLELMEDEDILEAGIRIAAQPPGKKLQNMMQLSGGEKALAAIALLFAIQNLKPSPFCLLDEIEAALDESNVSRFAKYLHKLTKNTQFIVITHRRGTMEQVDRLYGITMQEKGVSALVSVNLIDKELDN